MLKGWGTVRWLADSVYVRQVKSKCLDILFCETLSFRLPTRAYTSTIDFLLFTFYNCRFGSLKRIILSLGPLFAGSGATHYVGKS